MRTVDVLQEPDAGEQVLAYVSPDFHPDRLYWDMHRGFEIHGVLSGSADWCYGRVTTNLGPGEVWLTPAWEPHGHRALAPDTVLLRVCFLPEFLGDEALGSMSWLELFVAAPGNRPRVRTSESRQNMLAMMAELQTVLAHEDQWRRTALRLGVLRLLLALAQQWEGPGMKRAETGARPSDLARVTPALDLVNARRGRPVSLKEAATACSLSISRFSFLFQQTMGLSFGAFALRQRLGLAAQLILSSDSPLDVIADRLGFADASHLHHSFVKRYGCTPARYRETASGRRGAAPFPEPDTP